MYEDILEPRRQEISNYYWAVRAINPQVTQKIKPRPSPQYHKDCVLKSRKVQELIEKQVKTKRRKKDEVEKQIKEILDEIGYTKNLKLIRWLGYTLTKMLLKMNSGIYVNYDGVQRVKSQMGKCPVLFVPTHRSYADFIIFSFVSFFYNIEIPAIAAGMDFHSMIGVGEMLRNTGAFFMRRAFNNDSLYWDTFKEYIHQIVTKGDLPIEFFIEGTRSRSNKSVVPKFGLINMILKSYFLGEVPDVLFVPVSCNYDRVLEDSLFAYELLGIPKPKESTSGFLKSLSILKEKFGNTYFHFDDPLSTREFFEGKLNKSQHSFGPVSLHETTDEERQAIPPLAYEIVRRQQKCTVLSYSNLIFLILNDNLSNGQKFTSIDELSTKITSLQHLLNRWGANVFKQNISEAIKECLIVHQNTIKLEGDMVGLVETQVTFDSLNPAKLKGHALKSATISYSVPFITLQRYSNPVLYYLVDVAIVLTILRSGGKMNKDDLFNHYHKLRTIFSYEFVLHDTLYNQYFNEALERLREEKIITNQDGLYDILQTSHLEEILLTSIQPFILAYFVVIDILRTLPEVSDEKTILSNVQRQLEEAINNNRGFIHPYCLSLETLGNCLLGLVKLGVVKKQRRDGKNVFNIDTNSIRRVRTELETYIPAFQVIKGFDVFLHIRSKM